MSPPRYVDFLFDSWLLKPGHPQPLGTHVQTADLVPTITSDINLMSGCSEASYTTLPGFCEYWAQPYYSLSAVNIIQVIGII